MEQESKPENLSKRRALRGAERELSHVARELPPIEAVSKPYRPLQDGQNARWSIMSLPRVRWMERPEV